MPRTKHFRSSIRTLLLPELLILGLSAADAYAQPEPVAISAPRVDVLDFYGLRSVTPQLVMQALGTREGGPLPLSKGEAEFRVNQLDRVLLSDLEAIYEDGRTILYVGIQEEDAPFYNLRERPGGAIRLPAAVIDLYGAFLRAAQAADARGDVEEDLSRGYSIRSDPETRRLQGGFLDIAANNLERLREVLRESGDDLHRAAAAYILGYSPRQVDVVNDLGYALQDASPDVRANAANALRAFSVLALRDPEAQLRIPARWFIDLLHSVSWSDRHNSMETLLVMTEQRFDSLLRQLREQALVPLEEMARWKTVQHAKPAFVLLARAAEIPETEIDRLLAETWTAGSLPAARASVIESVLKQMPR